MMGGNQRRRGYIRARSRSGRSGSAPPWAARPWIVPAAAVLAAILLAVAIPLAVLWTQDRLLAAGMAPEEPGAVTLGPARMAAEPWAVICTANRQACAVEQKVETRDPQGRNAVLMRVTLGTPTSDGSRRLTVELPPNIRPDKGIDLQIGGDGRENRLELAGCTPGVCATSIAVDATGVERLEAAHLLHITFTSESGGRTTLPIGLDALAEALRQLALVHPGN